MAVHLGIDHQRLQQLVSFSPWPVEPIRQIRCCQTQASIPAEIGSQPKADLAIEMIDQLTDSGGHPGHRRRRRLRQIRSLLPALPQRGLTHVMQVKAISSMPSRTLRTRHPSIPGSVSRGHRVTGAHLSGPRNWPIPAYRALSPGVLATGKQRDGDQQIYCGSGTPDQPETTTESGRDIPGMMATGRMAQSC